MLQSIRLYFGIANASLANYLGISIVMMQSKSNGSRRWTLDRALTIEKLHKALDLETPLEELENGSNFRDTEKKETVQLIAKAMIRLERDLLGKKERLDKLKDIRTIRFRGLHACERLLLTNQTPHERKWVEMRQRHLQGKLKDSNLLELLMLEAEISSMETKLDGLKSFDDS